MSSSPGGLLLTSWFLALACSSPTPIPAPPADTIFRNGVILTMDPSLPRAQALAVRGAKIVAVGVDADVEPWRGGTTKVVDLRGRAIVPGFIESFGVLLQRADPTPDVIERGASICASRGWTTLQDGVASAEDVRVLTAVANDLRLCVDTVAFPRFGERAALAPDLDDMDCVGTMRIGGVTLGADGDEARASFAADFAHCVAHGWHVNAIVDDQAQLDALIEAVRLSPPPAGMRVVAVMHTDAASTAALEALGGLGVIATFRATPAASPNPVLGPAAAVDGLVITLHDDSLDTVPNALALFATAVRAGVPAERALRALTIDAAFQLRMAERKGSLTVAKLADLVVLSADPTVADPDAVEVIATLKAGRTVFPRAD